MTKLWIALGRAIYYITWPGIWLVIRLSPPRTRVFVIHNGQLLLVRDWLGDGSWKLPGGGLHRHEPAETGAIRELKEETGIDVYKLSYLGDFYSKSSRIPAHIVCFMVEPDTKPDLRLPPLEVSGFKWIPLDKLTEVNLSQTTRSALEHFGHFW